MSLLDPEANVRNQALCDRLRQLKPRVMFAESSYSYNGKLIDISTKITKCANKVDDLVKNQLVVIGSSDSIYCKL